MKPGNRRGHVMLELALSAAVMISCLAATLQFGQTFHVYNQLVTATGNGGRYAALRTYRTATPGDIEKGNAAIRNMVVYGDAHPPADAAPVVPNLKPENVLVERISTDAVRVSIVNYRVDSLFATVTLSGKPAVEFPFVGRYAPGESEPQGREK